MNRRQFFNLLVGTASLSACANNLGIKTALSAFDNNARFNNDYPEQLPYASISVQIGNGAENLLVLGKAEGEQLHWISADRCAIVTQNGRIVQTVGLTENLTHTAFIKSDFLATKELHREHTRFIDIAPQHIYDIKIQSTVENAGHEQLTIGNKKLDTTKYVEKCQCATLDWNFTNTYWRDEKGQIVRSIQHTTPRTLPMLIQQRKAYRAEA